MVHTSLSLHCAVVLVWLQAPVPRTQPSSVHGLLSSQLPAVPEQTPVMHVSPLVHGLLSSHVAVAKPCWQPSVGPQLSEVHTRPSSHDRPLPLLHKPPAQMSPMVQVLPSVQGRVLLLWEHPPRLSQFSVAQGLPSSQLAGALGVHRPPTQVSPEEQLLPSSHVAVLLVNVQPKTASQLSSVHTLLSMQVALVPPKHTPLWQLSPSVHTLQSLQGPLALATFWQPLVGSQTSSVQSRPSSQLLVGPGAHTDAAQRSPLVQALPSSHAAELLVKLQPSTGSQLSVVHGLPSSQEMPTPPQTPPAHTSTAVHALPSSQPLLLLL